MISFRNKRILLICLVLLFGIALCGFLDYHNPAEITPVSLALPGGIKAISAPGNIVLRAFEDGTVWSARGYWIYENRANGNSKRIFKVPSGQWKSWLGNFRSLRALTSYKELCDVFRLRSGTILAFSGGYIWRSIDGGNNFQQVHKLRHFGPGIGRGVLPQGMTEDDQGTFYYGEYFMNKDHGPVFVYRSLDDGKNWEVMHSFKSGEIRHIHALEFDPYTHTLWIATGDLDHECIIGYFIKRGGGVKLFKVVSGSQKCRAVSLLFTKEDVFWGTDSPDIQNWIYRLDRRSLHYKAICKVDGPIYYSTKLLDKTMIMGRTVEGGRGEWDDLVSLWVSKDGERWIRKTLGKRNRSNRYAVIRFARGNCSQDLYLTLLNTEHHYNALLKIRLAEIIE
jgi:hypothetical protein